MSLALAAILVALLILWHLVEQRQERARRAHCASCLRSLSTACVMYSMDFDGRYPTNWAPVAEYYAHAGKLFDCKSEPGAPHDSIEGVDGWSDFTLVPGITTNDPPDVILAYEPLSNHGGDGANVVDRKRDVRWASSDEFRQLRDRHGKPLATK